MNTNDSNKSFEYVVVGSGAGGGTTAARLAEAGKTVLLLEAGGDPRRLAGGNSGDPDENRLPFDYDIPFFHRLASVNEAMTWNFFVRHYDEDALQLRDPKFVNIWKGKDVQGVFYPRGGTLGGCTANGAMIFVCPNNAEWDYIAELTGDSSWQSNNMRRYFLRLENCRHRRFHRWLSKLGINSSRHGFGGWLHTERAVIAARHLIPPIAVDAMMAERIRRRRMPMLDSFDPNDWRVLRNASSGIGYLPMTTQRHSRVGSRERVLDVARKCPERLEIRLNALATRIFFDDNGRAAGVKYLAGERLYRAHAVPNNGQGEERSVQASREVILAGGAFNTPQLLMLSGIGPRVELERYGIPLRVDLPGVGKNLQDHYEVGVVNRMNFDKWSAFEGATFSTNDSQFHEWATRRSGPYSTNGAELAVFRRSAPELILPDLCCVAYVERHPGYFLGYSQLSLQHLNYLTWVVRKTSTNKAGKVTLRSSDPRDPPMVNFRYFDEGSDHEGKDLDSVVEGIRFVRKLTNELKKQGLVAQEELPGEQVQSTQELQDFARYNAWGHQASCSCAIGPREQDGVLDSAFRVHGTRSLRVVDASVFPRIPGFFIANAVYMIGEKAADAILADAK
jgi:choline dehydrogenase-like flavoprotein